jgi:3-deoxy-manno-octulosonate cytidylyltransferase (CMP-KDO synthetase)
MTKIVGVVPARMASSRFPGKPLHPILGRPMLEHVFCRARLFPDWSALVVATCDAEIAAFAQSKAWAVVMTADTHTRALDRVAEAAGKLGVALEPNDIVVNVQGDEPMVHPDMIAASIRPLLEDPTANCTLLAMEIVEEKVYRNPDALKVVHDLAGNILYTSRSPIPHCKVFSPAVGARRIYGIFAFRWHFLQTFTRIAESPLEIAESCDSNRIFDNGYRQKIAPFPYRPSYSVDNPSDTAVVEAHLGNDPLWGTY